MTTNEKFKLVWSGVYFQSPIEIQVEEKIVFKSPPTRLLKKATMSKLGKNIIHTQIPYRPNQIFVMKSVKSNLSKSTGYSTLEESFTNASISSYGMLQYENYISSRKSTGMNPPSITVPGHALTPTSKSLHPIIQAEIDEKPNIGVILEGYVNHIILKKKLPKDPDQRNYMNDLYKICIESSPVLKRLVKKDNDFLPQHLRDRIKNFALSKFSTKILDDKSKEMDFLYLFPPNPEPVSYEIEGPNYAYASVNDVSVELLKDNQEFKRFYQSILLTKTFAVRYDEKLIEMRSMDKVLGVIEDLCVDLIDQADVPDAISRRNVLVVLKSAKENLILLKELSLKIDVFFEGILLGLYSKYRTVVEDCCFIISFICFQPILAQTLINNSQFDVAGDIVSALFKAMEFKPYWFWIYNYALGYIIGCSQQFSILEVILERVIQSKQPIILFYWPNFIYYATRFWEAKNLSYKPSTIIKIIQYLEHCIIKRLSYGPAKRALIYFSYRSSVICKLFTVWPN